MLSKIIGFSLIVVGILLGLYVGIYVCFIGGIVDLLEVVKELSVTSEYNSMDIAIGIAKLVLSSLIGILSFIVPFLFGMYLVSRN